MLWCSVLQITLLKQAVANLHQTKVGDGDLVEDHWDCLWIWKWKVCMLEILRSALWLATDGTAPPGPWVSQLPTALHNNLTQSEVSASTCLTNSYSMSCHSIVLLFVTSISTDNWTHSRDLTSYISCTNSSFFGESEDGNFHINIFIDQLALNRRPLEVGVQVVGAEFSNLQLSHSFLYNFIRLRGTRRLLFRGNYIPFQSWL